MVVSITLNGLVLNDLLNKCHVVFLFLRVSCRRIPMGLPSASEFFRVVGDVYAGNLDSLYCNQNTSPSSVKCDCTLFAFDAALGDPSHLLGTFVNCCYLKHPIIAQVVVLLLLFLLMGLAGKVVSFCLHTCCKQKPQSVKYFATVVAFNSPFIFSES